MRGHQMIVGQALQHTRWANKNIGLDRELQIADANRDGAGDVGHHTWWRRRIKHFAYLGMFFHKRSKRSFQRHVMIAVGQYGHPSPSWIAMKIQTKIGAGL